MRPAIVNGRALEHYKDFDVRETGLAVPREPKYRYAISNGYAPEDFIVDGLVLYLPFYLLKGSKFKSVDRYKSTCTVTGALWRPYGREFDGDDYIEIPANYTRLNFTSGDFAGVIRVKLESLTTHALLFTRGIFSVDGWYILVRDTGILQFRTNQSEQGQTTDSAAAEVGTDTWYTLGFSRSGATVTLYKNGVDVTSVSGTHFDPATCARTTKIGIYDDKTLYPLDGKMEFLAVWGRALSAMEHLHIDNVSKWRGQ